MTKKKKTTTSGEPVMVKSVHRTRSRRMKFCVHGGLGALPSTNSLWQMDSHKHCLRDVCSKIRELYPDRFGIIKPCVAPTVTLNVENQTRSIVMTGFNGNTNVRIKADSV